MTEDYARLIDSLCKIAATVGLIGGGIWGVVTYFDRQREVAQTAAIEARKPFESDRLDLYMRASKAAAVIAYSEDSKEIQKAREDFETLLGGPMVLVEDRGVATAMVKFFACFHDKLACDKPIRQLCEDLARECRASIARSWNIELPDNDVITWEKLESLRH